jgi:pyruvate dehydrogenase E1 component alpha subunit
MFLDQYDPLKGQMVQILDEKGNLNESLRPKELTDERVLKMYEDMVFVRTFNNRALKMQRTGRMGTFASIEGQEAAQIGPEAAIEKTDWVVPAFREHAIMWKHGVTVEQIFNYWRGNENGSHYAEGVYVLPVAIPVASQALHAVGLAGAAKMRGEKQIAVGYFGDGATSEGDFHEAMNFAGVFKSPTIFICQNNQYAISTSRRIQTASKTIAQKAVAYGFPGVLVDGNDLFAMYAVTKEAADRARKGEGPTFIEAYTYRLGDHTTSDDSTKYRLKEEVEAWRPKDPLKRLQIYLEKKNLWNAKYDEELQAKYQAEVDKIVERVEATPNPGLDEIFSYTYAQMTQEQIRQLQYAKDMQAKKGGQNA